MTSAIDIKHYTVEHAQWCEQLLTSGHFENSFISLISFRNMRVKMVTQFCCNSFEQGFSDNYIEPP
jgi:hypothetical protein